MPPTGEIYCEIFLAETFSAAIGLCLCNFWKVVNQCASKASFLMSWCHLVESVSLRPQGTHFLYVETFKYGQSLSYVLQGVCCVPHQTGICSFDGRSKRLLVPGLGASFLKFSWFPSFYAVGLRCTIPPWIGSWALLPNPYPLIIPDSHLVSFNPI